MSKLNAYQEKLEAQLDEWQAQIDQLEAKTSQVTADLKLEYDDKIKDLRAKQAAAQEKLTELKNAGQDTGKGIAANLQDVWSKLGRTVKDASSRLKGRSNDHTSPRS